MTQHPHLSRRQFLKWLAVTGAAAISASCSPGQLAVPTPPPPARSSPTHASATVTFPPSASPSQPPTAPPTSTTTPISKSAVAVGKAGSYDPALLRREVQNMLDGIGGFGGLVQPGARVGIKVNLTGGTWWDAQIGHPATELFATHPALVGVLGELLIDAGAGELVIVDGLGDERNFEKWGYVDMARPLGARLVDLGKPDPYPDFQRFPVGPQSQVYDEFLLNPTLAELDVFLSVAKMKCHSVAGVTLSLKNLFGLPPISLYRQSEADNNRSMFHISSEYDSRLSRIILDLNQTRPVHFAVIDGIFTAEGGAGPWDPELSQVKPGVLVAGRDAVAVDAVSTAIMGFDPAAASGTAPFTHCDNYLALAQELGLGTNSLKEIPIVGPPVDEVMYPFKEA